jgi:ABC-2 type transport system permease protein
VSVLAKYRYVFLTGLQSSLVYRWNFAARSAFSLVHLSFVFILWGAAYRGQTDIGGFNLAQTLTYFLAMLVIQFFISAQNEDYQIGEDIRNGMINQFLLKPIDYYAYRLTLFFSARLVTGCLALLPILLAYPLFADTLSLPSDPWRLLYGALLPLLRERDYHAAFAGIAQPNPASLALHLSAGFTPVGTYREVGWKLGAWRDVAWFQRLL